jgi:hypothetical protein
LQFEYVPEEGDEEAHWESGAEETEHGILQDDLHVIVNGAVMFWRDDVGFFLRLGFDVGVDHLEGMLADLVLRLQVDSLPCDQV